MRLDDRDRGRILLVAVITLLALPTIWLVNRDDEKSTRPNVAAAGLAPGEADSAMEAGEADSEMEIGEGDGAMEAHPDNDGARTNGADGPAAAVGPATDAPDDGGFDPMGATGAEYLEPAPTATPPPAPVVVVGTSPYELVGTAVASYRHEVASGVCLYNGAGLGELITVVNVANGRTTTCTTTYLAGAGDDEIVLNTDRFSRIADLITAPVHVEIRQ